MTHTTGSGKFCLTKAEAKKLDRLFAKLDKTLLELQEKYHTCFQVIDGDFVLTVPVEDDEFEKAETAQGNMEEVRQLDGFNEIIIYYAQNKCDADGGTYIV